MSASAQDYEQSSDPEYDSGDENDDFTKRKVVKLVFTTAYAPDWDAKDAFREFYQNWRDGIVQSHEIPANLVKPIFIRNDHRAIHIEAFYTAESSAGKGPPRMLGYIIYNSAQGSLEMTNFLAKLERKHLDLGETTKRKDRDTAGGHGEGFKVGALVLCREGYAVKFETNSLYWNFGLTKDRPLLYCALTKPKQHVIDDLKVKHRKQQNMATFERKLTPRMWEDMTVRIGKSRVDKHHIRTKIQGISEETFRTWLTVSLDLDPPEPTQVIHTRAGDLILDPRYRGRIYLKTLLVSQYGDGGSSGRNYRFGYNFNEGKINRDRQSVTNPHQEARMLSEIWESAVKMTGASIVDSYIDLFNQDGEVPDIAMALDYVSRLTAGNICKHLKVLHPQVFFYSEREKSEQNPTTDEDIISKELRKRPVKLPMKLWKIIRKFEHSPGHPLMHTPLEERKRLFEMSPQIDPPADILSVNIVRALEGSLALEVKLSGVRIEFVEGARTNIDLLYDQQLNVLRIHGKWLDFDRMHRGSNCEFFRVTEEQSTGDDNGFFCDHVVQDLLEAAFEQLRIPFDMTQEGAASIRRNAVEYLRQMPRAINLVAPNAGKALEVNWIGNESGILIKKFGANIHFSVTLHKASSCKTKRGLVLNIVDGDAPDSVLDPTERDLRHDYCGCPSQVVARAQSKAIFDGLDHKKAYFPMVSRTEQPSFFGLPPSPLTPREWTVAAPQTSAIVPEIEEDSSSDYSPTHANSAFESDEDIQGEDSDEEMQILDSEPAAVSMNTPAGVRLVNGEPAPDIPLRFRSQHNSDSSGNAQDSVLEEDEKWWIEWHEQVPLRVFSRLMSARGDYLQIRGIPIRVPLHAEHLEYTFERYQYVGVQLVGALSEQVIFIHNILQHEEQSVDSHCLLVTKYSHFVSTFPFSTLPTGDAEEAANELVLHFNDFDEMRKSDDAELISLADISSARLIDGGDSAVRHVFQDVPADSGRLFCRFGIRNTTADGVASLTPLTSRLSGENNEPWPRPVLRSTATPQAVELSPEVLGVSEGFSKAGCIIQAAFGLDGRQLSTWQDRHNSAQPYDGPALDALHDVDSGRLPPVRLPVPMPPKVVLFAGKYANFRINDSNERMPTLQQFLHGLDVIDMAAAGKGTDFVVMFMPPALLHESAVSRISETISRLLKMRFSVHLKIIHVGDYGLPQDRNLLVLVASPICAQLPWKFGQHTVPPCDAVDLGRLIADLTFGNSRVANDDRIGLVCSRPGGALASEGTSMSTRVYNHYTGLQIAEGGQPVQVEETTTLTLHNGLKMWMHWSQDRRDRLTIRELARVQGLPDDFVFWGTSNSQYKQVCRAIPPVISMMVAETIRQAIRDTVPFTVNTPRRNNKRARVEDAPDEE